MSLENLEAAADERFDELGEGQNAIRQAVRAEGARNQAAAADRFDELGDGQDAIRRAVRAEGAKRERDQADMMTKINAIYASLEPARPKGGKKGVAVTELGREAVTMKKGKAGKLGRGSHGVVKKGELETDSGRIPVAIKVVAVDDEEARRALQRELEILVSFFGTSIVLRLVILPYASQAALRSSGIVHLFGSVDIVLARD